MIHIRDKNGFQRLKIANRAKNGKILFHFNTMLGLATIIISEMTISVESNETQRGTPDLRAYVISLQWNFLKWIEEILCMFLYVYNFFVCKNLLEINQVCMWLFKKSMV